VRTRGRAAGDGIHSMVPRERMDPFALKLRDNYARLPGAPLFRRTFGLGYCLETWRSQGLPSDVPLEELFLLDPPGNFPLHGLGWCEAAFVPEFDQKVLEDRGDYELVQDVAGRAVLYFKGRRQGFMPEYVDHPVKDWQTWQDNCKWRLESETPARIAALEARMPAAVEAAGQGLIISQRVIGGCMFLRSLLGPVEVLYAFYDMPDLLHDCMQTWLRLADAVMARHQKQVTIDELFLAEDICYNHGPLYSPQMMKEFLFPYYQQLVSNVRSRQLDRNRHLYVHVDTDGRAEPVIPLYGEAIGMDVMSPFEVASGCDVVDLGRKVPDLAMFGGIDKRVLARGPEAIDRHVETILPAMRERGGYIPTCDHGVPPEVRWQDYLHYRKRCVELGG